MTDKRREHETTDTIRFVVTRFSKRDSSKKTHSDKKRDPQNPEVLWRVKVYPRGNGTPGFLALYIDVANGSQLPYGWRYPRDISFTVLNGATPAKNLFRQTSHVFTANEPDWGYNQIAPLATLAEREFLPEDTLTVIGTFKVSPGVAPTSPLVVSPSAAQLQPPGIPPPQEQPPPAVHRHSTSATRQQHQQPLPPPPELAETVPPPTMQQPVAVPAAAAIPPPAVVTSPARPKTPPAQTPRGQATLKIAEFSKVEPGACVVSGEMETNGVKWRLVAYPHATSGPAGAISAFVEAMPTAKGPVQATVSIRCIHPRNRALSLCYIFTRDFAPSKPKGFSCIAIAQTLEAEGFLVDDTLTLAATFLPTAGAPPEAVVCDVRERAFSSQVLRVEGFPSQQDASRVFGHWEPLGAFGHWRVVAFPRGSAQQHDNVAAAIEVRPGPDAKPGWHLRCAMDVHVAKPATAASSAAIAQLASFVEFTENKLSHQIPRLVPVKDLLGQPDEWLADDALLISASLRTDPATGTASAINDKRISEATERLQTALKSATRRAADIGGLVNSASALAARDAEAAKKTSAGFKEQLDAIKELQAAISALEDKMKQHDAETSELQTEQERLSGGCKPEELSEMEEMLTKTLQKLLILQGKAEGGQAAQAPAEPEPAEGRAPRRPRNPMKEARDEPPESLHKQCVVLADAVRSLMAFAAEAAVLAEEATSIKALLDRDLATLMEMANKQEEAEAQLRAKEKAAAAATAQLRQVVDVLKGDDRAIAALQPGQIKEFVEAVQRAQKAVISKQAVQQFLLEQQKAARK